MMDYTKANEILNKARNGRKKLANNTYLYRVADGIAVRLHETDVIILRSDNTYELNTGGWQTVTTKARINEFSPARLYQVKGIWYLRNGIPYVDGIVINSEGEPSNPELSASVEDLNKQLDKLVKTYVDGYASEAIERGSLTEPSSGDCWGCLMVATNGNQAPLGYDHIISHFAEKYYVPSLLVKALQSKGYKQPGFIWHLINRELSEGKSTLLKQALRYYFRKIRQSLITELNKQLESERSESLCN